MKLDQKDRVLVAFIGSDRIEEKEDECCHGLGPFLCHGDAQVRQAARQHSPAMLDPGDCQRKIIEHHMIFT